MSMLFQGQKDFWSGLIFLVSGAVAVYIGGDYAMGTAGRMGPAYFPSILGALLCIIGAAAVVRSMVTAGEGIEKFTIKGMTLVIVSTLLFGFLVRGAGLAIAVVLMVLLSGLASIRFKLAPFLAVAVGLAVFSVLVFVKALGLPMPMFGSWLGF